MRIIVCVKQVIDTAAKIRVRDGAVDAQGSSRILNPYDEFAVEEAVRIREKKPDAGITLISLGPEGFRDTLRTGLAMGADKAVHLLDPEFEGLDNLGVAHALVKAIRILKFDLILCGRQAVDDDMAQVGPAIAALLEIPYITVITRLEFCEDYKRAVVTRQIEGGAENIETSLPALLTCQKGLNEPRLPSLKGIMAAKKKEIQVMDAAAIGFDADLMGKSANRSRQIGLEVPPQRRKGKILSGPDAVFQLVKALRDDDRVV